METLFWDSHMHDILRYVLGLPIYHKQTIPFRAKSNDRSRLYTGNPQPFRCRSSSGYSRCCHKYSIFLCFRQGLLPIQVCLFCRMHIYNAVYRFRLQNNIPHPVISIGYLSVRNAVFNIIYSCTWYEL